jgi:hypothetical protein
MTAYNVINPTSMVGGQPEDVSVVLANFQAIAAVLNGGIDNANIAPGANIDSSKIAGSAGPVDLSNYQIRTEKGVANGYVPLDGTGKIPSGFIPAGIGGGGNMNNPMTTLGDLIYAIAGGSPARLGIGLENQMMVVRNGVPTWLTPTVVSVTAGQKVTTNTGARTMAGYAVQFTPQATGRAIVMFSGPNPQGDSGGGTFSWVIRYGTGTPPGTDSAETGTQLGTPTSNSIDGYGGPHHYGSATLALCNAVAGLAIGTPYWFDLAMQQTLLQSMSISIAEI